MNMVAYKVGMAHLGMVDDSEAPSKNTEIGTACTILEFPKTEAYGIRLYRRDHNGYKNIALEIHHKEASKKHNEKRQKNDESKLSQAKEKLSEYCDVSVLMAAYPKGLPAGQHHAVRFESAISGKLEDKFNFASACLGKEFKPMDAFKNGEYVDISSVTKGKGWAGTIKRFGTARLFHKATGKVRHIGTLGPFTPGKVLFTVPQAGQLGFNYRTEPNKRILKIGNASSDKEINPKSGFLNYGNISSDYMIIKGSVGGPSKRLVRIRKSDRNSKGIKEPKINYMSIGG